ncbi:MAG: hypothetical protein HY906_18550 [Deltaproteobacteria bacterium]|nr:hypothetical protein [Deltaproteobacteria bacterium]
MERVKRLGRGVVSVGLVAGIGGVLLGLLGTGCSLQLEPKPGAPVVARFDPEAGVIPVPSDVLLDREAGHLDLPIEDGQTPAEVAFRQYLNGLEAWSTTFPAKLDFSGRVDRDTITADTFQLWRWGTAPQRVEWRWGDLPLPAGFEGPTVALTTEKTRLEVTPPRRGWDGGATYVMLLRGGPDGAQDVNGRPVDIDVAFYYLRLAEKLDEYRNQRAFPGDTRAARLEKAAELEEVRLKLAPFFEYFEANAAPGQDPIPRDEIVALWSFTATTRSELCMDKPSQRMPLPFDLLIDPATGKVDLPAAAWDKQVVADGKLQANRLDGFGVSADFMFELTRAVDPSTATNRSLKLYRLSDPAPAVEIPIAKVTVMSADGAAPCQQTPVDAGCKQILLRLADADLPLTGKTTYVLVVHDGLRGLDGKPVVPMLIGHFMTAEQPLALDGVSQLESVVDTDAARLEGVRGTIAEFLTHLGRNDVVTAWPLTTMDALPALRDAIGLAGKIGAAPNPENVTIRQVNDSNRADSFGTLFPGNLSGVVRLAYESRLDGVGRIVEGTIKSPYFLDRQTRRWHLDGSYELEDVHFIMTVPENPPRPTPVVIFGHAIVTDRRFVLTIAGALAQKGFASVAVDFPFHGERIACVEAGSLISFPNFLPQELQDLLGTGWDQPMLKMYPCKSGADATCSPDGKCLDQNGNPEAFSNIIDLGSGEVLMDMKPASGAAFLDINDIPYINDHFAQAVVDLGALKRSLREGYWEVAAGTTFTTDKLYYAGQSLGGIIGATYVAMDPDIARAVLNVPGCDLVDMFQESVYFGPQVDDYFNRNSIPLTSYEHERNMNVVRWLIDSVDPHTVALQYRTNNRAALIQMDSGELPGISQGDFVIPNRTTRILQRISGLPMREYPSAMHGDLVIPLLGDQMLADLAAFMAGEINQ